MPPQIATAIIGTSSIEELDHAVAAIGRGPLPAEALDMLSALPAN
jgi:aryl-alcohol dehydrogenase-like predicted oxidoreductase